MTSIEPTAGAINDTCIFDRSGLILLALDCSQIPSYFVPALGPAPKWCSYLENLTEEMEEGAQTTIYDYFKFLAGTCIGRCVFQNCYLYFSSFVPLFLPLLSPDLYADVFGFCGQRVSSRKR